MITFLLSEVKHLRFLSWRGSFHFANRSAIVLIINLPTHREFILWLGKANGNIIQIGKNCLLELNSQNIRQCHMTRCSLWTIFFKGWLSHLHRYGDKGLLRFLPVSVILNARLYLHLGQLIQQIPGTVRFRQFETWALFRVKESHRKICAKGSFFIEKGAWIS